MAVKTFNARAQQKIDTSANWAQAVNFVPLKGEIIVYSDLNKSKIGDGVTTVVNLPFFNDASGKADKVANATNGDLAGLDSNGNLTDSGKKPSDFITTKDAVPSAPVNVNADTLDNHASSYYATASKVQEIEGDLADKMTNVSVTSADNGKFLRVVNGAWAADTVPNANGVSF